MVQYKLNDPLNMNYTPQGKGTQLVGYDIIGAIFITFATKIVCIAVTGEGEEGTNQVMD